MTAGIQLTQEERLRFRRPSTARLVLDFSMPWAQAILGCALFIVSPSVLTWIVAVVLVAGAQHGLALIAHEAAHFLICPEHKRRNDLIGTYLFAAPTLMPFHVFRQRHAVHHRLVSQSGDTKDVYRRDMRGWRFVAEILGGLSGTDYVLKVRDALKAGKGEGSERFASNLRRDQVSIVLVNGVLFLIFTAFDPLHYGIPTYYFILWLWPLVTVSFLLARLRAVVEHQPPRAAAVDAPPTPYFWNTPGPLLRSVHATWLERLLLSKINFHYHAEHHLWPWASYQHLPALNAKIWNGREGESVQVLGGNLVVCDRSYGAVLGSMVRGE